MARRFYGSYEGIDERRRQEYEDSKMIPSGSGSQANMPEGVIMHLYPKTPGGMSENLNDTMKGVDLQISKDESVARSNKQPGKA